MEGSEVKEDYLEGYSCDIALRWAKLNPSLLPVDELDKEIICLLRYNARMSNAELAKTLRTSEATVRRRISALVEKGIIIGFSALVNLRAVENSIKVYMKIRVRQENMDELARKLLLNSSILSLYRTRENGILILEALFLNIESLQEFEDSLKRMDGVEGFETDMVTKAYRKNPWVGI
ncbi:transcriptional regulator [Thermogymnomonas acidicola]|uniref:Transcriptional regulator n=1 Tax=Thermogymnomonas acidicola TaxID=399579 RepID=A0AA37F8T7_9ARCH|nr:Lrp/AsnC family transcriptional regulator [Thermogymnomonas acidicola]GGM68078.1 transcriptional regulator [Thermogymnomonas acidicola]